MTTRRPVFYVSPHPEDVVLSCGGSLAADVAAGRAPTLLTVFAPVEQADLRRAEDRAAAALLGCALHTLDLPEAAGRPEVRGPLGRFAPLGQRHLGLTCEVVGRLRRLIPERAEVYAPLGAGGHIDHRVTQVAAAALAEERGLRLWLYEDLPYCLALHTLGRRLAAMGATIPAETARDQTLSRGTGRQEVGAYLAYLLHQPGAGGALPWPLRRLWLLLAARAAVSADRPGHQPGSRPHLRPVVRDVTAQRAARLGAAAAYASRWPLLFGSPARMEEHLRAYGQHLGRQRRAGQDQPLYERLWLHSGGAAGDS